MTMRLLRLVTIGVAVAGGHAAMAQTVTEDCRAIPDAARRLACYDQRDRAVVAPAPAPVAPASGTSPQVTATAPAVRPAPAPENGSRRPFDSRIVAVTPVRHGLFELRLEDGSLWSTTAVVDRPEVGDAVHYRRTFIGTHYFDIKGRRAITVRPER